MAEFINGIETSEGNKKINYEALGNIPKINGIPIVGEQTSESLNLGMPSDETVKNAVQDWLNKNPEATTSVQNGSISMDKLSSEVTASLDEIKEFLGF